MNPENILHSISNQWAHTGYLEMIAVLMGVLSVIFARCNHVGLYPSGILSTAIYSYLLSQSHIRLYAEALLNLYYFLMSLYGWYHWTRSKGQQPLAISTTTFKERNIVGGIVLTGSIVFYVLLTNFTNSDVAIFDATAFATACAGMWLLAKRKLENWILLNISNFIAIPLFFYKNLPLTGLLTIFLFVYAILGYRDWKKFLKQQALSQT